MATTLRQRIPRRHQSLRYLVDTVTELADRGIGFHSLQEAIYITPGGKVVFHVVAALTEFGRRG
jgi:DNA invertase Pin-like site-specific DNA recombinase